MNSVLQIGIIILSVACHWVLKDISVFFSTLFFMTTIALICITTIVFLKKRCSLKITIPDVLLLLFFAYLFIRNEVSRNERALDYLLIGSSYFLFTLLYEIDKKFLKYMFYGLLCGYALEVIVGLGQLLGISPIVDDDFLLSGLLNNPGAFAGYLSVAAVFFLSVLMLDKDKSKSSNLYLTTCIIVAGSVIQIIFSHSRGSWIALIIGLLLIMNRKYALIVRWKTICRNTLTRGLSVFAVFALCLLIGWGLYQYKSQSAFGRWLVWKVSTPMSTDNPIIGGGVGTFEANYGKVQADYFLSELRPETEVGVADYVTVPYNEYLAVLINSGSIGLLLLLAILAFALFVKARHTYSFAAQVGLASLCVLGLVSYPFRLMPQLLFLFFFLFVISRTEKYYRQILLSHLASKIVLTVFVGSVLYMGYYKGRYLYGTHYMQRGYERVLSGAFTEGENDYRRAAPYLQNHRDFQFYHGALFYLQKKYDTAILYLQNATRLSSNPNAFISLGNALQETGRFGEAEAAYLTATGITPAKLYPKYLLAKLYVETGETSKALEMARTIIEAKEKIPTTAGKEIKAEMKELVRTYSQIFKPP